jgi:hypothetical protein
VLREDRKEIRTEVTRIFEYLMSGISLVAAATGIGILVVALIESATGANVISNGDATNTLLLSLTLLLVGVPAWWMFWSRIQNMVDANPEVEVSAPTRRSYLYLLLGVGGIAAIVSLITGIFLLFSDVFQNQFGLDTFRGMRFAIGVLLTTGTVAAYHLTVYRGERHFIRAPRTPHSIILVGPKDPELVREIVEKTGDRVQVWVADDAEHKVWSHSEVMALLAHESGQDLLILMNGNGLEAIPMVHV